MLHVLRLLKKRALYLSVNVFSRKVLIGDTILTSPTENETAILRGHSSHARERQTVCSRLQGSAFIFTVF